MSSPLGRTVAARYKGDTCAGSEMKGLKNKRSKSLYRCAVTTFVNSVDDRIDMERLTNQVAVPSVYAAVRVRR